MSMPIKLEPATAISWPRRVEAVLVVGIARLLVALPPARIRHALGIASRGAAPATAQQALGSRRAVVSASRRCAGQQCLQRSVAVALLCRLHGAWPEWRVGVRLDPFRAHAWVEAEGVSVGEAEDMSLYRPIMTVPARCPGSGREHSTMEVRPDVPSR